MSYSWCIITYSNNKILPIIYLPFIKTDIFATFRKLSHQQSVKDIEGVTMLHEPQKADTKRRELENSQMKNVRFNEISIMLEIFAISLYVAIFFALSVSSSTCVFPSRINTLSLSLSIIYWQSFFPSQFSCVLSWGTISDSCQKHFQIALDVGSIDFCWILLLYFEMFFNEKRKLFWTNQ